MRWKVCSSIFRPSHCIEIPNAGNHIALVSYKDEDEEHLTSNGDSQERVHAEQSVSNTTLKRQYDVNGLEGVEDSAFVNVSVTLPAYSVVPPSLRSSVSSLGLHSETQISSK